MRYLHGHIFVISMVLVLFIWCILVLCVNEIYKVVIGKKAKNKNVTLIIKYRTDTLIINYQTDNNISFSDKNGHHFPATCAIYF